MILLAAKTAIKEPKRSSALVRRETFASYCFLLPSLIFFLGFVIYPMVLCVVTSFFDSTMNRADIFVGLANYKELFTDPIFLGALKNTFIIVVVSVPVTCAFSLWVSSAIVDLPEWATSLFRCVFYLPVVTGSVAVTVVWKWMYNNYYGIFNYLGKTLGLIDKNINWLGDERFALGCIILFDIYIDFGDLFINTCNIIKCRYCFINIKTCNSKNGKNDNHQYDSNPETNLFTEFSNQKMIDQK